MRGQDECIQLRYNRKFSGERLVLSPENSSLRLSRWGGSKAIALL
jgi:hypothetical protein